MKRIFRGTYRALFFLLIFFLFSLPLSRWIYHVGLHATVVWVSMGAGTLLAVRVFYVAMTES
jgi:hypothetical protein